MNIHVPAVIVGGGIAGTCTALYLRELLPDIPVLLLDKSSAKSANSNMAKGGLAAERKDIETHIKDTMIAGAYQNNEAAVRRFCREAEYAVYDLMRKGVAFNDDLHIEGGHSTPRIFHISDISGKHIMKALQSYLSNKTNGIYIKEHTSVLDVMSDRHGKIKGLIVQQGDKRVTINSNRVVFAGGGAAGLYATTTNGTSATGDLIGIARKNNLRLRDTAFIQFHPTLFNDLQKKNPPLLITEALRGAGAQLVNQKGNRFMVSRHHQAELAPRDIVTRAIDSEYRRGNRVYLDARRLNGNWESSFENLYRELLVRGINPKEKLIPVRPGAHYLCGGIETDFYARTSLPGLYAVGECAYTGFHGANRLASNSLTEAVITAKSAAADIAQSCEQSKTDGLTELMNLKQQSDHLSGEFLTELQNLMEQNAGIIKTTEELKHALNKIKAVLKDNELPPVIENSYYCALSIVEDSLSMEHNCGVFYNRDLV